MYYLLILLFVSIKPPSTESAKILGIFTVNSRSHHSINQPILKGLASRGHEVTIISHFKSPATIQNYTEILLDDGLQSFIDSIPVNEAKNLTELMGYIKMVSTIERQSCTHVLNMKYIQELINSEEKSIDLLMVEVYHMRCYHLLAHKLNVPLILVSPPSVMTGIDHFLGNPNQPSYLPLTITGFSNEMSFFERLENSIKYAILYWCQVYEFPKFTRQMANEYLHMEAPADDVLNKRVALGFYNNHFSFIPRPKSPNTIDIAGIHIQEAKKLPKVEHFYSNLTLNSVG